MNYGFALFHTEGLYLENKNPLTFCYFYWPDMAGWEYIDSKYKTISPKGELKISGTRNKLSSNFWVLRVQRANTEGR